MNGSSGPQLGLECWLHAEEETSKLEAHETGAVGQPC